MKKQKPVINGRSVTQIADDTGLKIQEVSMALNAKRLLRRDKLKQVVDAGYPLEPFVFGLKKNVEVKNESPAEAGV